MQLFQLGQWFRNRYSNFLTINDVYLLSADLDVVIMSAETFAAGLFPPINKQIWNPDLMWQPIPVHTLPLKLDNLMLNQKYCPKYNELLQQFENSPGYLKVQVDNQNLFEYLTVHTGQLVKNSSDAGDLYDTLKIESDHGYTLPNWTTSVFPSILQPFFDLDLTEPTFTTKLARFQVGPLFDKITSQFENTNTSKKFTVYAGCSLTLSNVLNSLRLYEHEWPPNGAVIIFELFLRDGYFVNVLYKDATVPRKLKLNDCEFDCPLDKFREIIQPLRLEPHEWDRECFEPKYTQNDASVLSGRNFVSCIIIGVVLAAAFVWFCKLRNNKREKYMVLQDFEGQGDK